MEKPNKQVAEHEVVKSHHKHTAVTVMNKDQADQLFKAAFIVERFNIIRGSDRSNSLMREGLSVSGWDTSQYQVAQSGWETLAANWCFHSV